MITARELADMVMHLVEMEGATDQNDHVWDGGDCLMNIAKVIAKVSEQEGWTE